MHFRSFLAALPLLFASVSGGLALELRLPADCTLGKDCFLQQFPDMKKGDGAVDPYCGVATYEDHDGVDLRILSMTDIKRGVPVVAVADGEVLRGRDGMADRLIATDAQRKAITPQACGNGVVMSHADGVETQYCHLRKGSIVVKPGQKLKAGDKIGEIGASGLVQFPHVHLTVRVKGKEIDPLTGNEVGTACIADPSDARPLFAPSIIAAIKPDQPTLLGFGLSGTVLDHDTLAVSGIPNTAKPGDPARVAWAWLANMRPGDRLKILLAGPDGKRIAENTTDPIDRSKAIYFSYAGKKGSPAPGLYKMEVTVIRSGAPLLRESREITVE
jgi:murein DD-endopeptidase MepM/ murein hydrolase activator NlpD